MSDMAFWLGLVILIVLFAGEPDLLDAITTRIGGTCP